MPPQQKSWWAEKVRGVQKISELPKELVDLVIDDVSNFPISLEEAKEIRLKLMEERKIFVEDVDKDLQALTFSFCEH